MINDSVLDLIGNTPMVDVTRLSPNPNVRIIAKLESQNPFGSVKDRIAKQMIEQAEKDGTLQPGQRIIEPSSGNTGIALAAIAQMKGHPITILMPEQRFDRAPTDAAGVRRRADPHPGRGRQQRRGASARRRWPPNIPSGASSINTATTTTRSRTTRAPARRFGATAPRSRTSSPASARAAR